MNVRSIKNKENKVLLHFSSSNSFALQRHTDFNHSSRTAEHYTLQNVEWGGH